MSRTRQAADGGTVIEVAPDRIVGWVARFADRHGAVLPSGVSLSAITLTARDGATADLAPPFVPMDPFDAEPVEAILRHIDAIGDVAVILVRARAYSVGIARAGKILSSTTDTRYVQGRTKAGGWSQQRYARRRGNQRRDAYRAATDAADRVLAAHDGPLAGLVIGGDAGAIRAVLSDARLGAVSSLPRRTFTDVREPRRAVLDAVAQRCLTVTVTVREPDTTSGT